MHKALHPRIDIDREYVSRIDGGIRPANVGDRLNALI